MPPHLSALKRQLVTPLENTLFLLTSGTGHGMLCHKVAASPLLLLLLLPPFFPPVAAESHLSATESQSRDFDDVGASWACCGLDARSCRVTRGRGRPPLRGPVEAIAIRAQSRGRRETDNRRGDAAAFAVDPAAVVGFQVEVGTTRETKTYWKRVKLYNVHLLSPYLHVSFTSHGVMFEVM